MVPPPPRRPGAVPLVGFYLLYFCTIGITLPFLPAYFKTLGFSATAIGALLALGPMFALLAPPVFGHLADRTGRTDRVLSGVMFGAVLGLAPLLYARSMAAVFAAYAVVAFFTSTVTTLIDSLAFHRVATQGGSYAHLRLFGSIGFVLSSIVFGLWIDAIDRRVIGAVLVLAVACLAWTFTLGGRARSTTRHGPLEGLRLLRHRDIALLLAATSLHWFACAPYHGTFSIHVTALGLPPAVVGLAAGIGVVAEVAVMMAYPRFFERLAPRHVLFVAFVATALRWLGMALTSNAYVMLALSILHGLTFGAFYVASVGYMARRVPETLRASGQALYVAITFGVGGLTGYLSSGAAYDLLAGHRLFAVAAGLELVAAVLVLRLRPVPPSPEPPGISAAPASSAP